MACEVHMRHMAGAHDEIRTRTPEPRLHLGLLPQQHFWLRQRQQTNAGMSQTM